MYLVSRPAINFVALGLVVITLERLAGSGVASGMCVQKWDRIGEAIGVAATVGLASPGIAGRCIKARMNSKMNVRRTKGVAVADDFARGHVADWMRIIQVAVEHSEVGSIRGLITRDQGPTFSIPWSVTSNIRAREDDISISNRIDRIPRTVSIAHILGQVPRKVLTVVAEPPEIVTEISMVEIGTGRPIPA